MFDYFVSAAPHTLLYLLVSVALAVAYLAAYTAATPQDEFRLIREGKLAPAISLVGALLGFVIPLGAVITHSVSITDLMLWGAFVLLIQLAVFYAAHLLGDKVCGKLGGRIQDNCLASGLVAGGLSLAVGILTANCLVP